MVLVTQSRPLETPPTVSSSRVLLVQSGRVSPSQMIVPQLLEPMTDTYSVTLTSRTPVLLQSPQDLDTKTTTHTVQTATVVLDHVTPTQTLVTSH